MQISFKKSQLKKAGLWIVGGVLVVAFISWAFTSQTPAELAEVQDIKTVAAAQFSEEIAEQDAVILDIRTPAEYNSGRISGSVNIDYYESDFKQQLEQLDRNASYKIYCNSGNRSASALRTMKALGFTDVTELSGGIQAWASSGNDVCTSC